MRSLTINPTNRAYKPSVSERLLSISFGNGITGLLRDHPVYRVQRQGQPDERLGDTMLTDLDISGAKAGMFDTAIADGWEIEGAGDVHDFVVDLIASIPNFQTVLQFMFDQFYYGWRLLEKEWATDGSFKGRKIWKYSGISEKETWEFHFSPQQHRLINFSMLEPAQQFTKEEEEMWFIISRYGSISRPYGKGIATELWFEWYRRQLYRQAADGTYQQAINGLTVVKSRGMGNGMGLSPTDFDTEMARIKASLDVAKETLDQFGFMVLVGDLELEKVLRLGSVDAWEKINGEMGLNLRRRIEMSTLTTVAPDYGTHALGKTQENSKTNSCRRIAEMVTQDVNDQIIGPAVRYNFGEVPREKRSRFIMNICRPVDVGVLTFFLNSGVDLDADILAARFNNIPIATSATSNRLTRPESLRVTGQLPPASPVLVQNQIAEQSFDPLADRISRNKEVDAAMSQYFEALRKSTTLGIEQGNTDFLA